MNFQASGENNYEIFRECVSGSIVNKSDDANRIATRRKKKARKKTATAKVADEPEEKGGEEEREERNPEELAEFIDFIASETFTALPPEVQSLSYSTIRNDSSLATKYTVDTTIGTGLISRPLLDALSATIPLSVSDSLSIYGIIPNSHDTPEFLRPIFTDYICSVTTGPPVWAATHANACEICERDWIPLSYHHLIPREVHAKVLKRGWHEEWMLNSVAWLCRACHSFVHKMASNDELARKWFTVDRILQRDDVQDWARWVGRVRWKAR